MMTTPDPSPAPTAPVEQAEIDAVRGTARWLVAVAGAVFAALMAGVQLSAVGRLADYPLRLGVAVAAGTIALLVVAAVLVQAVRVLVDPGWTLEGLAKLADKPRWSNHWLRDRLGGQRGALGLGTDQLDLPALYRKFVALRRAWSIYCDTGEVTVAANLDLPNGPTVTYTPGNIDGLDRRVTHHEQIAQRVAAAASLLAVRRRFRQLKNLLVALGAVPIATVAVFAVATAIPAEAPVTAPLGMIVQLNTDPAARDALASKLAPTCLGRQLHATAVGGTLSNPIVVRPGPDCPMQRLEIIGDVGIAYPANPR